MNLWERVSELHLVGVMLAAGLGAVCRGGLDMAVVRRLGTTSLPWATLAVNVIGSLVLGMVLGWAGAVADRGGVAAAEVDQAMTVQLIMGIGFAGGLTTFSTFSWESFRLVGEGRTRAMVGYATLTVVTTLLAVVAGVPLGRALA